MVNSWLKKQNQTSTVKHNFYSIIQLTEFKADLQYCVPWHHPSLGLPLSQNDSLQAAASALPLGNHQYCYYGSFPQTFFYR